MDGGRVRLPANLDIDHARLPANYAAARQALARCSKVDECQSWADKMAALASYARQLNDEILLAHCRRIQARAIRRANEVLDQIEPARGQQQRNDDGTIRAGTVTNGRVQAARAAGLSDRQRVTARRVGAIPTEQFESLVESDNPPTITVLAELGTNTKSQPATIDDDSHLNGRDPADFQSATRLWGGVRAFQTRMSEIDLEAAARGLSEHEAWEVRVAVDLLREWLARVDLAIGGSDGI